MALNPYDVPGTTGEFVTGSVQAICTLQCAFPFWSESELPWHEANPGWVMSLSDARRMPTLGTYCAIPV